MCTDHDQIRFGFSFGVLGNAARNIRDRRIVNMSPYAVSSSESPLGGALQIGVSLVGVRKMWLLMDSGRGIQFEDVKEGDSGVQFSCQEARRPKGRFGESGSVQRDKYVCEQC